MSSVAVASAATSSAIPSTSSGSRSIRRELPFWLSRTLSNSAAMPPSSGRTTPICGVVRAAAASRARRQPPLRQLARLGLGQAGRRAQLEGGRIGHGAQHDLSLGAAARGLHVQLLHAEQALERSLGGVDRLDARDRDAGLVGRHQPGAQVERVLGHPVDGRAPAQVAHDQHHHHAHETHAARRARARGHWHRRRAPGRPPRPPAAHARCRVRPSRSRPDGGAAQRRGQRSSGVRARTRYAVADGRGLARPQRGNLVRARGGMHLDGA